MRRRRIGDLELRQVRQLNQMLNVAEHYLLGLQAYRTIFKDNMDYFLLVPFNANCMRTFQHFVLRLIRLRLHFVRKEHYRFDYTVRLNRLDRNQLFDCCHGDITTP